MEDGRLARHAARSPNSLSFVILSAAKDLCIPKREKLLFHHNLVKGSNLNKSPQPADPLRNIFFTKLSYGVIAECYNEYGSNSFRRDSSRVALFLFPEIS